MSVGVVLPRAAFQAMPRSDHGALLERAIAETPAVARAAGGRAARVAGARREGLLVRVARLCRRPLAARRRCRVVSRSRVFDRRRDRARVRRSRRRRPCPAGSRPGDLSRATVQPVRAPPAAAVPVVPPLRARVLHAGVPRPVLQRGSAAAHVSRRSSRCSPATGDPSLATRCWVAVFFLLVRLQRWFRFAPSFGGPRRPASG